MADDELSSNCSGADVGDHRRRSNSVNKSRCNDEGVRSTGAPTDGDARASFDSDDLESGIDDEKIAKEVCAAVLMCKLCDGPFERPKTLPCQHSFCAACLVTHTGRATRQYRYTASVLRPFECPECHQKTMLTSADINSLPDNFVISRLRSVVDEWSTKSQVCQSCAPAFSTFSADKTLSGSKAGAATFVCLPCGARMCDRCAQRHRSQLSAPGRHHLYDLRSIRDYFCTEHAKETVAYLCVDCSELVCVLCVLAEHRGHSIMQIGEAMDKIEAAASRATAKLEEESTKLSRLLGVIDTAESACRAATTNIERAAQAALEAVANEKLRLTNAVKVFYQAEVEPLVLQREALAKYLDDQDSLHRKLEDAHKAGSDYMTDACDFEDESIRTLLLLRKSKAYGSSQLDGLLGCREIRVQFETQPVTLGIVSCHVLKHCDKDDNEDVTATTFDEPKEASFPLRTFGIAQRVSTSDEPFPSSDGRDLLPSLGDNCVVVTGPEVGKKVCCATDDCHRNAASPPGANGTPTLDEATQTTWTSIKETPQQCSDLVSTDYPSHPSKTEEHISCCSCAAQMVPSCHQRPADLVDRGSQTAQLPLSRTTRDVSTSMPEKLQMDKDTNTPGQLAAERVLAFTKPATALSAVGAGDTEFHTKTWRRPVTRPQSANEQSGAAAAVYEFTDDKNEDIKSEECSGVRKVAECLCRMQKEMDSGVGREPQYRQQRLEPLLLFPKLTAAESDIQANEPTSTALKLLETCRDACGAFGNGDNSGSKSIPRPCPRKRRTKPDAANVACGMNIGNNCSDFVGGDATDARRSQQSTSTDENIDDTVTVLPLLQQRHCPKLSSAIAASAVAVDDFELQAPAASTAPKLSKSSTGQPPSPDVASIELTARTSLSVTRGTTSENTSRQLPLSIGIGRWRSRSVSDLCGRLSMTLSGDNCEESYRHSEMVQHSNCLQQPLVTTPTARARASTSPLLTEPLTPASCVYKLPLARRQLSLPMDASIQNDRRGIVAHPALERPETNLENDGTVVASKYAFSETSPTTAAEALRRRQVGTSAAGRLERGNGGDGCERSLTSASKARSCVLGATLLLGTETE